MSKSTTIQGGTTIYGKVERIKGLRAFLRLLNGDRKTVDIRTVELADQIAERKGTIVGLNGTAKWNVYTLRLVWFTAEELTPYRETPIGEAFKSLAESAAGHWDNIDPDEYIRELRAD